MKKNPKPPASWPPQAQKLYWDFHRNLFQRMKSARDRLLSLDRFFRYQEREGFTYREFPLTLLDAYIQSYGASRRTAIAGEIRCWLRFLFRRKELLTPLHEELVYNSSKYPPRTLLSYQQVLQVLQLPPLGEAVGLRDRAYLEMAYGSGLRRGELMRLNVSDLDLNLGLVHVGEAKNSFQRRVPLTRVALDFLLRYLEEGRSRLLSPLSPPNALWLNRVGKRIAAKSIGIRLQNIYQVKDTLGFAVTVHQLRHACATHLLSNGAPLRHIQELLGHREIQSTQIYTHVHPTHLRRIHDQYHPRNNGSMRGDESPPDELTPPA